MQRPVPGHLSQNLQLFCRFQSKGERFTRVALIAPIALTALIALIAQIVLIALTTVIALLVRCANSTPPSLTRYAIEKSCFANRYLARPLTCFDDPYSSLLDRCDLSFQLIYRSIRRPQAKNAYKRHCLFFVESSQNSIHSRLISRESYLCIWS